MNEFENIQRLLRLKRYETPGDDFVEDFVTQFRERQRSELLRQSARGLLWERVNTFFSDLVSPKWSTAAATACVAVVAAWGTLGVVGSSSPHSSSFDLAAADVPAPLQNKPSFAVDSVLIKEALPAEENGNLENILLSKHWDGLASRSGGGLTPVSMTAEMLPSEEIGY